MAWPSGKAEACKASIPSSNLGATLFYKRSFLLYLVATPIGNLSDITFRAVEILKSCDYILCEDTRHSRHLLNHYQIEKPLKSFHKFSESSKENAIIEDLKNNKQIALISDAGTPGISDPGEQLVRKCKQENIVVQSIPGACALITALASSGLPTTLFQFCGFLPKKAKELKNVLREILTYPGTTICYESPKRLKTVLKEIQEIDPEREVVVARELTKKFEEIKSASALQQFNDWSQREIKGEIVLLIAANKRKENFENLSPQEHVELLQKTYEISKIEAIKMAASLRGVPKRDIYNEVHT